MSLSEVVALFAEISLGLSGFAGVASAFAGRRREFRPVEKSRVGGVLLNSGAVLAGSLVFLACVGSDAPISTALRLGASASFVVSVPLTIYVLPPAWRHLRDPDSTTELWVLLVTTILIGTSLCLYAATAVLDSGPQPLMSAFTIQVLIGLWMFGRLLTREN